MNVLHKRVVALVMVGAVGLSACTIGEVEQAAPGRTSENTGVLGPRETTAPGATGRSTAVSSVPVLTALPGTKIAVADSAGVSTAGEIDEGPAWSTSKVPLSLAALRASMASTASSGEPSPEVLADVEAALTASDNAAAMRLWESLGTPEEAGAAVQAILREAGDDHTRVETRKVRPEFSSFGQTAWALSDQAAFAVALPTLDAAPAVLDAMGRVIPEQSYGLGTVEGMRFKGGWGPDTEGRYTVRQLGVLDTPCGVRGVAIAAQAPDGTYETAQELLTEATQSVSAALRCE
ncbi:MULTISPECIES: hypothetical protein [unclassified Corynebacterium]|uniref:hypothetical protein n=1 Tax=unclassified Corynebacterium TaxID=2624378 RepID=UPI0029CA56CD|nr:MULTISPECIES: hypothetical protein [unclassified Corynebacterium]WPF65683.1 hypothetical protein OLX12_08935 [Corynebacterium sp. 22KM0430]WPF68179.1 hypothetical protein OLW90_08930 [Corynebacterium sp. 21KM1197]